MVEQLFELQVIGLDNFCRVYVMVGAALRQTSCLNCAHCVRKSLFIISPLANGCNIVGCHMLRSFAHSVACYCVLLGVVAQSLTPVKRLS